MADLLGIHTPGWHPEERTPMVDGKYYDKKTGELLTATDDTAYLGPPAVDIIITTVYSGSDASNYRSRWARAFPIEDLIWQMAKVFKVYELAVDSVTITPYAIRIILSTVATKDDMIFWADRIANGIWNPEIEDDKLLAQLTAKRQGTNKDGEGEANKASEGEANTK